MASPLSTFSPGVVASSTPDFPTLRVRLVSSVLLFLSIFFWRSLRPSLLLRAVCSPPQVIYEDGIIVRDSAEIEKGSIVGIAHPGSILNATGKVRRYASSNTNQSDRAETDRQADR